MSSFDKLRFSFDNLLRELDDICKSIDDLTDLDQIAQAEPSDPLNSFLNSNKNNVLWPSVQLTSKSKQNDSNRNMRKLKSSPKLIKKQISVSASSTNSEFIKPNLVAAFDDSFNVYKTKQRDDNKSQTSKKHSKNLQPFPSLNNLIGSVRETALTNLFKSNTAFPLATAELNSLNSNTNKGNNFDSNNATNNTNNNLIFQNDDERYSSQELLASLNGDRLNFQEISQIECFYSSMGCYVYVSRSTAELYQIKKEDEFDAIDQDPVKEYHDFMMRKKLHEYSSPIGPCAALSNEKINYMYLNSGVPVLIFNYGQNSKRKKDLRVLLAERSTGFCMFEFKFDCLTQLLDSNPEFLSNQMTICKLKLNELCETGNNNSNLTQFTYQNEYFERFFNSKNRHAHKEHLLKFIMQKDCEDFCSQIMQIISDKRNLNLFKSEYLSINSATLLSCKQTGPRVDLVDRLSSFLCANSKSSVIICHFLKDKSQHKSNFPRDESGYSLNLADSVHSKPSIMKNYNSSTVLNKLINGSNGSAANRRTNFSKNGKNGNLSFDVVYSKPKSANNFDSFSFSNNNNLMQDEEEKAGNFSLKSASSVLDLLNNFGHQNTKNRKLKKTDISSPVSFSHVTHLDKPVPIGKRYKVNY